MTILSAPTRPVAAARARALDHPRLWLMAAVWVVSFPSTRQSWAEIPCWLRMFLPEARRALAEDRVLLAGRGAGFALWSSQPQQAWCLDYLVAWPRGRGHGSRLLTDVLAAADARGVAVTLNCRPALLPWYRRHGFFPIRVTVSADDRCALDRGLVKVCRPAQHGPRD